MPGQSPTHTSLLCHSLSSQLHHAHTPQLVAVHRPLNTCTTGYSRQVARSRDWLHVTTNATVRYIPWRNFVPTLFHAHSLTVGRSLLVRCWSLADRSLLVARCSLAVGRSLLTRRWSLVARSPLVARCSTLFHAHSLAVGRPLLAHRWSREERKTMKNCVREMNKSGARAELKNYKLPP